MQPVTPSPVRPTPSPAPRSAPATSTAAPTRKVGLAAIRSGKRAIPVRMALYGPEGIGKTTFAADAPAPIFLDLEDGSTHLDVARFEDPRPSSWPDVLDALDALLRGEHSYKTVVIDTLDRLEAMIWAALCERGDKEGPKDSIEGFGYGKGYAMALDRWRVLLARLDELRAKRDMGVLLVGHTQVKMFKNPAGEDYDRYQLRIHDKAAGLIKEWCEVVGFGLFETVTRRRAGDTRAKGAATGARILYTHRDAAWDAKTRYALPERLPFTWSDFAAALAAGRVGDPAELRTQIDATLVALVATGKGPTTDAVRAALGKAGDDSVQLSRILDRLTALGIEAGVSQASSEEV